MLSSKKLMIVLGLLVIASMVLAACQPAATTEPETVVETVVVTVETEGETVVQVVTPTAEPVAMPDTLVICMGQEPETLYNYGGSMLAQSSVLEAVYDGPIDQRSFDYQAIILEKMPSIADGDAVVNQVTASEGDKVLDADGNPITLDAAADPVQRIKVSGSDEAVDYTGGDVTMDQLVVTFKLKEGLVWSDGTPLTAAGFGLFIQPCSLTPIPPPPSSPSSALPATKPPMMSPRCGPVSPASAMPPITSTSGLPTPSTFGASTLPPSCSRQWTPM